MESIVLEVNELLAKAWNNSSPASRAAYEKNIIAVLKEFKEAQQVDEDGFTKARRDFLAKEAEENTQRYEWWNDEEMVAELDRRSADLESEKDKGGSWDEVKARLLKRKK